MIKMLHFYKPSSLMKVIKLALEWQSRIILDQQPLHVHNFYIRELKSAYKSVHEHHLRDFNISIVEKARPIGEHARSYNAPKPYPRLSCHGN